MRPILLSLLIVLGTSAPATARRAAKPGEPAPAARPAARPPAKPAGQPAQAPAQADPLPTVEEVRKVLAAGDAPEALKQVNRLLSLRGKAAEGYDRYELLTLKGDAHLKLKGNEAAAAAFRQAAAASDDPQLHAVARATELLVRRSRNLAYTPRKVPKGEKAESIDIAELDARPKALAALFIDEVTPLLPKVEAAKGANSVIPMIRAMAMAREVEFLERAANGSADQVRGMIQALGEQGEVMLGKVVEKATKRVDRITTLANEIEQVPQIIPTSTGGYRRVMIPKRRGIKNDDITDLKAIIDACDEVIAQANALGQARGTGEESIEDLTESAEDLKVHAQRMLRVHNVEYAGRRGGRDS